MRISFIKSVFLPDHECEKCIKGLKRKNVSEIRKGFLTRLAALLLSSACVFAAVRPACICFVCPGRIISILKEDCGKSVGTAAASLRMGANRYPIHAICLHLFAVMDDMHFKQTQQAQRHLPAAWKTARPDGLVEDFAENHKLLGGMPEAVIKPDRPEDFGRLTEYGAFDGRA